MKCECCGREKDVLVEIGAVSPKVAATGRCCLQCCTLILASLEDEREEVSNHRAEILPVDEEQIFVDGSGNPVGKEKIRFGMTDAEGRKHFFCVERIELIYIFHIPKPALCQCLSCPWIFICRLDKMTIIPGSGNTPAVMII